jgi:hypothetical protein
VGAGRKAVAEEGPMTPYKYVVIKVKHTYLWYAIRNPRLGDKVELTLGSGEVVEIHDAKDDALRRVRELREP